MTGIPAIVINLDRSVDRLAHMRSEFQRAKLEFERFPAVNRTALPDSIRPYFCDASGRIVSPLGPGEIGCYASHLCVWQRIAAGCCGSAALVCEDDMVLPAAFGEVIANVLARAPIGWDLIKLSSRTKREGVPIRQLTDRYCLVRYSREPGSTAAYLITQEGARKLLLPGIRHRPVDQDLRRPWAFGLEIFGIWPPMPEADLGSTNDQAGGPVRLARRYQRWAPLDMLRRPVHGIRTLGLGQWVRCTAQNIVGRKQRRLGAPGMPAS